MSLLREASNNGGNEAKRLASIKVLETVLRDLSQYSLQFPGRPEKHARVVKECVNLFYIDNGWQRAIANNRISPGIFYLEKLIASRNPECRRVGHEMGLYFMAKANLEAQEVVEGTDVQNSL